MIDPSLRQKVAKHIERLSIPMITGMIFVIKCPECDYIVSTTNVKEIERASEYMRQHKELGFSNGGAFRGL